MAVANEAGAAICEALGLKRVKRLAIVWDVELPTMVEATMIADHLEAEKVVEIVKRFKLVDAEQQEAV